MRKGKKKAIRFDPSMLAIKWMDEHAVTVLTTVHDDTEIEVERRTRLAAGGREMVLKPKANVEYNKYMGGVDLAHHLLLYYGFGHRTVKWWRRAFFLLDTAVVNSYILYTMQNPDKKRRLTHEQFRVALATDLLHAAGVELGGNNHHGPHRRSIQPAACLIKWHFPIGLRKTSAGRPLQHDCSVCSRKKGRGRKTTTYKCRQGDLAMCIVSCFELHYTKRDPQRYLESVC